MSHTLTAYVKAEKVKQVQELMKSYPFHWMFNPHPKNPNEPEGDWHIGLDYGTAPIEAVNEFQSRWALLETSIRETTRALPFYKRAIQAVKKSILPTTGALSASKELIRAKQPSLLPLIQGELNQGNLVILLGGICSGKSWLIAQLIDESSVVDKSMHQIKGDHSELSTEALRDWAENTNSSIAVDEAQLFKAHELASIAKIALNSGKGILLATQQEQVIPIEILQSFTSAGKEVLFLSLEHWKKSKQPLPTWSIEKRLAR